ncbi:substrate-binding domain-containing protein [Bordetella sp. FB-8]|uniref:helix-turn-helix transcriptional regulator n=1 Tax=Bordetella sp. FB-8 TaxID=1159870 RepID=UPI00035F8CC0|nr:substrate-binding domain-containing protein [Bordetella sp. FB-8]
MTYKFQLNLRPQWSLDGAQNEQDLSLGSVLSLLSAIDTTGHIAGACRACGLSYRHAWGVLRRFESVFGTPLLITRRRQGTQLSEFAQRLLWANRRIEARLAPTLESMASELQEELERLLPRAAPHLRLHASHGFAVEAMMRHVSSNGPGLELRYRTAVEALASLKRSECDLAGFQVPCGEFEAAILEDYRPWLNADEHILIHLAVRSTGLFVQPGNPKCITGIADLARPDVRFVNRQIGSSTRHLITVMLERAGLSTGQVQGYDTSEFTHMAIAAHIASGMADTGVGVETAAQRFGLQFILLARERYFFAVRKADMDTPAMRELLAVIRSPAYIGELDLLPGYEIVDVGQTMTLKEAFP